MPAKKAAKKAKPAKKKNSASKSAAKAPPKAKPHKKAAKAAKPAHAKPAEAPAARAPAKPAGAPPLPTFVKTASPADRKAALEALLEKEGVKAVFPTVSTPMPRPPPSFVKESSARERKAIVEQLVQDAGVASALSKAPWKRTPDPAATTPAPPPPPAAPPANGAPPHTPAAPERTSPKIQMTKPPATPEIGRSPPKVVLLDSNALMMQFQFHVDIEREVRRILDINVDMVVPSIVVDELERLAKTGNTKEAAEARMAVELARTFRVEDAPGAGDTGIMKLADQLNAVVVTNDKRLRAILRAKGIPNIFMRNRAFLTIEGHIPGL